MQIFNLNFKNKNDMFKDPITVYFIASVIYACLNTILIIRSIEMLKTQITTNKNKNDN
jgi:ABC-type arginine/histidine transport system permease subunit